MRFLMCLVLLGAGMAGGCMRQRAVEAPVKLGPTNLPIGAVLTTTLEGTLDCPRLEGTFAAAERYTILANDAEGPSKIRVSVVEDTSTFIVDSERVPPEPSPLKGETFVAERGLDKWQASSSSSDPNVAEELADWSPSGLDSPGFMPSEPVMGTFATDVKFDGEATHHACELTGLGDVSGREVTYLTCRTRGKLASSGVAMTIEATGRATRDLNMRFVVAEETKGTAVFPMPGLGPQRCEIAGKSTGSVEVP